MKVLVTLFLLLTTILSAQDLTNYSYEELDSLAEVEITKGQYLLAKPYAEEGQNRAKIEYGGKDTISAMFVVYLGRVNSKQGNYKESLKLYTKVLNIYESAFEQSNPKYIKALSALANTNTRLGNYDKSKQLFNKAIAICKKYSKENTEEYTILLNSLAFVHYNLREYEACIPFLVESSEIQKRIKGDKDPEYAKFLFNISVVYRIMGNYEEAEPLLLTAGAIWKENLGTKHPDYASFLDGAANLYRELGKYEVAESFYLESLAIKKETVGEQVPLYRYSIQNLAYLYTLMGKFKKAEALYLELILLAEKRLGKQHIDYAIYLNGLATIYEKDKEYLKAEPLYEQAKAIAEKALDNQSDQYSIYLNNLANIYSLTKQYDKAEALYLEALANANTKDLAIRKLNIGYLYTLMGRYGEAQTYLYQSLINNCKDSSLTVSELKEDLSILTQKDFYTPSTTILILDKIYRLSKTKYDSTGVKDKASLQYGYSALEVAMILNEKSRKNLGSNESSRLLKQLSTFVGGAIDRGVLLGEKEYVLSSFSHAEKNKSILLADAIKGNRARTLGDLPDSLVYKELKLQKEQKNLRVQAAQAKDDTTRQAITKKQNALSLELDGFLKLLKDKYPKYHALKYENITAKAEEIQALLDDKTTLLEYFVADSASYLFALSKEKISLYKIPITRKKLQKEVRKFRKSLTNYQFILNKESKAFALFTEKAYWFYENYLKIALAEHQAENLIIVADAELGYLPFETFLTKAAKTQKVDYKNLNYLINDYKISYNYSATLWKENLNSPKPINNSKVLACAASYGRSDSNLLNIRKPNIFKNRAHLQPLPAAQTEITALSKHFQGDFLYRDSTNEAFFKENAQNYGVIHLAMHGIVHNRVPMLSSLAFTENGDSIEDNFLQAYEISKLRLNADLVVLSACETGYGKFEQGEGVVSLARSFMYAGVPSLVVSLWQVNDNSTARIMKDLYIYLAQGMPKDQALREAKLNYIKNAKGAIAHPAFWSPFIQLGDSRPISIATKGRNYMIWMGGILGVLVLLLGAVAIGRKKELV